MGIIGRKNKTIWTEELIVDKLRYHFLGSSTVRYYINGLYVFSHTWESDFLALTKSGYLYEGEVKISKSDFKADFKKKDKHTLLQESYEKLEGVEGKLRPHYFFYAVPEGLITEDEIPEYAGLVYMTEYFPYWKWVKQAPLLHKEKFTDEELNLQEKFYYNMVSWKDKALTGYKKELEDTKQLLKEAKTDEDGKKYPYTLGQYQQLVKEKDSTIDYLNKKVRDLEEGIREYRRELHQLKEKEKKRNQK
jgi:hypothetical protein